MKEIMMNLSREMQDQMGEIKRDVASIKKASHFSKQEPEANNINIKEDIIIAGGACAWQSVEKFCWSTEQWALLPAMTSARWFSTSFVHQDQMFVCGGEREDTIEILELKKEGGEWKKLQSKLPQETWDMQVLFTKIIYLFLEVKVVVR